MSTTNNIYRKLSEIQVKLKATKDLYNSFGRYSYRSAESILEAMKPLLDEYKVALVINDDIVMIGERYYVKATARLIDGETGEYVEATAFAREDESKKGQDLSQLTGSTSSYARKYAMNGLLAIDDNKDSDDLNKHGKDTIKVNMTPAGGISEAQQKRLYAIANKAGLKKDVVDSTVKKSFGCDTKDMTKEQYQNICERLEKKSK